MANAPQKPQELIEYEKRLRTGAGQQSPVTTPGQQSQATTLLQESSATTPLTAGAVVGTPAMRTPVAVSANQTAESSSSTSSAIIPSPAAVVTAMPPNAAGAIRGFGAMAL